MKRTLYLIVLVVLAYIVEQKTGISLFDASKNQTKTASTPSESQPTSQSQNNKTTIQSAYRNRQSDVQIMQKGVVAKVLADDLVGSKHQKFILRFDRLSILVAHNIDLAPKIFNIKKGDTVEFYGEYEWNEKGGVVHWTHKDPRKRHIDGWLKHNGKTYQ